MFGKIFLLLGLTSSMLAAQPPLPGARSSTSLPVAASLSPSLTDPVQTELNQQKLKLRMPVGASTSSFDLSDSARQAMIQSPSVLNVSDQIQLTEQDSVTMRGLIDLPIASLSEVVSKMDYYTQIRFIRFGLLQLTAQPHQARNYAAKLYILTDEILPRKAVLDSIALREVVQAEQNRIQEQTATSTTAPVQEQPESSSNPSLLWLLLVLILMSGTSYWFLVRRSMRPQPKEAVGQAEYAEDDPLSASNELPVSSTIPRTSS